MESPPDTEKIEINQLVPVPYNVSITAFTNAGKIVSHPTSASGQSNITMSNPVISIMLPILFRRRHFISCIGPRSSPFLQYFPQFFLSFPLFDNNRYVLSVENIYFFDIINNTIDLCIVNKLDMK